MWQTLFAMGAGLLGWAGFVGLTSLLFAGADWKRHALYMDDLLAPQDPAGDD